MVAFDSPAHHNTKHVCVLLCCNVNVCTVQLVGNFMYIKFLWILFGFLSMIIYKVVYTRCLRYDVSYSAWLLDMRTSTCFLIAVLCIDLFHVTRKYNVIIRFRHFGRQAKFMPTTCAVVGCYNRHCKGNSISFYRFPTEAERWHRWISFVSRGKRGWNAMETRRRRSLVF